MEAYLSTACRRAGLKLAVGLAVVSAVVGFRIVTATPAGVEGELAELERFDAEQAVTSGESDSSSTRDTAAGTSMGSGGGEPAADRRAPAAGSADSEADDLDRMVRCALGASVQFMRASDCATRGGGLEELPPPEPHDAAALPRS